MAGSRRTIKSKVTKRKLDLPKSPHRISLEDAIRAAEELLHLEHHPEKPCRSCRKTLSLLKTLRTELTLSAHITNLVWPALQGSRMIDPDRF